MILPEIFGKNYNDVSLTLLISVIFFSSSFYESVSLSSLGQEKNVLSERSGEFFFAINLASKVFETSAELEKILLMNVDKVFTHFRPAAKKFKTQRVDQTGTYPEIIWA